MLTVYSLDSIFSDEKGLKICTKLHSTKNLTNAFGWKTGPAEGNLILVAPPAFQSFFRHWKTRISSQHHQKFWNGNVKWSLQIKIFKSKSKPKRAKSLKSIARYLLSITYDLHILSVYHTPLPTSLMNNLVRLFLFRKFTLACL